MSSDDSSKGPPRDDDDPTRHASGGDSGADEGDGDEELSGIPDPSQFGIDPNEMMRDPFGAAFKMLSNPEAMKAFEGFMQTPMAQKLLSQGMQSPMFQQMMANNPMLQKMGQHAGGFPDLGSLFGGGGRPGAAQPDDDDEEEDDDHHHQGGSAEPFIDEPVLDLLTSPYPGPAFPEPQAGRVASFDALLAELPEDARRRVLDIAETRVTHHLGAKGCVRLQQESKQRGLARAIDLLVCQGAFMGEVAWYSIVKLEDDFESSVFVPLARHALSCVTAPCGLRVPSFLNQLLNFLAEEGAAEAQDVRHAVWALSGQPRDAIDGVFEMTWDDVEEVIGNLAGTPDEDAPDDAMNTPLVEPRLLAAAIAGLVGWRELDLHERPRGVEELLDLLDEDQREPVLRTLAELIGGGVELEGLRGAHVPTSQRRILAERATDELGAEAMLELVERTWRLERPYDAWLGVLQALDVHYNDAPAEARTRFFEKVLQSDDTSLRKLAYQVGAAWEPHTWLERATRDADATLRSWAEDELKALR